MPIWLVNYAIARYKGEECMDFEEFINQAFDTDPKPKPTKRTAGEIMAEFGPIIDADRLRGARG